MKVTVTITLDPEAKEGLTKQAVAIGLNLSSYLNMLGHASKVYHTPKKEEKE